MVGARRRAVLVLTEESDDAEDPALVGAGELPHGPVQTIKV